MTANDYRICCALSSAYIARVSKRTPNMMLADRREITHAEKMTLIAWELDNWCSENEDSNGFRFHDGNGRTVEVHYVDE